MSARVLLVDDDATYLRTLARAVNRHGHEVATAADAESAQKAVQDDVFDVIVVDYMLPATTGLELLPKLRTHSRGAAFIIATGLPDLDLAVKAMRQGAFDYVSKAGALEECLLRIDRAAEVTALRRRMAEAVGAKSHEGQQAGGQALIGRSAAMRQLRSRLNALGKTDDTTVLLTGETGTGKGVVARWIHRHSGRAYEPFVAVDCTTIPATLVESELFGHEKGSFSGATNTKVGRVEASGRGTLFLDEIGELELPIQAKLLRLLEEREYTRVGSTRTRTLHARIIAATNRDLAREVAKGRFRADLRYRLEVFPIELPPLRRREEDIFDLTQHFLEKKARALGEETPELSSEVREALRHYSFPGNVRELRNMVEQSLLLAPGPVVGMEAFPVLGREEAPQQTPSSSPPAAEAEAEAPPTLADIRERAEREEQRAIVDALEEAGGNVSAAARALEMSRYQLLRRLDKFGLR